MISQRNVWSRVCLVLALVVALLAVSLALAQAGSVPSAPANAPDAGGWSLYPIYGGNMTALASDPTNAQVFYVGTDSAGVFKTASTGDTWEPAREGLPSNATVLDLTVDPVDPNTVYAGIDAGTTPSRGILWRSTNGGSTWTNITHNTVTGTYVRSSQPYNIIVDPHNRSTIYVALSGSAGQIYKASDAGATWWAMDSGIPRYDLNYTHEVLALAMDPDHANILYAGGRVFGI